MLEKERILGLVLQMTMLQQTKDFEMKMLMRVCLIGHDSFHEHRAVVEPIRELERLFLVCHFFRYR